LFSLNPKEAEIWKA